MSSIVRWYLILFVATSTTGKVQGHRCTSPGAKPTWKKQPTNDFQVFAAGEDMLLECATNGAPKPKVSWNRNNQRAYRTHGETIHIRGDELFMPNLISRVDDGNYTCEVVNCHGNLTHTWKIRVLGRAPAGLLEFNKQPKNQTITEGQTANLICLAYSARPCETRWSKQKENHHYVHHSEKDRSSFDPDNEQLIEVSAGNIHVNDTNLIIINATLNDTGLYTCRVICANDDLYARASITVLPASDRGGNSIRHFFMRDIGYYVLSTCLIGSAILLTAVISICTMLHRRVRERKLNYIEQFNDGNDQPLACHVYALLGKFVDEHYHIDCSRVKLCESIGEGAFGQVYRGLLNGNVTVAVKMLKESATGKQLQNLINEIVLMGSVKAHDNVIQFIGCSVTKEGCLQILMEYANHGNLRDFLQHNRPDALVGDTQADKSSTPSLSSHVLRHKPTAFLTGFAYQVASGMKFLAAQNIIHRDLAARNILVAEVDDAFTLKIADFGLTRGFDVSKGYYRLQLPCPLPIKWMSPESMSDSIFTTSSDVWSYGVLLWEIYTLGENPYPSIPPQNLYSLLNSGYRMPQPPFATDSMYHVMACCWLFDASSRPTFEQLEMRISEIIEKEFDVTGCRLAGSEVDKWLHRDANGNVSVNRVNSYDSDVPLLPTNCYNWA